MATFTNTSKNSSSFLNFLRHGRESILNDLANFTFESVVFEDGTVLKDLTFNQLVEQVWANVSKNSSTFTNVSRN